MSVTKEHGRKPDAQRTRADILTVARAEFVEHGLNGARVDAISERTRTTKRMIYYYFGSKEGLYSAVLQQAYSDIRAAEATLELDDLPPVAALRRLIEFTFDYEDSHPDFVRLIAIENIHQAGHLRQLPSIQHVNADAIAILDAILTRGRAQGAFTRPCSAVDVHLMISGLCFYRVSNRHTFGMIFNCDLSAPEVRKRHKAMIVETIVGWLG
ncbi:TetR family transcriptional regulator [Acidisphaera sp. S103]|uniref:TetR family transcriptional regulator n=1 Tax=Acidisphaera sp. S103 TaxID=1747223 RepID=UPI00131CAA54|nr:TetR family transcriptional regulator [Acidisphaera sp. S103]